MSFNHGYLNNASMPTSGNGNGDGTMEKQVLGLTVAMRTTTLQQVMESLASLKRLRVTHEDEDGDFFMNSRRLFPPAIHQSPPPTLQQHHQAQHDWEKPNGGAETSSSTP
jgi:hypothetical protein